MKRQQTVYGLKAYLLSSSYSSIASRASALSSRVRTKSLVLFLNHRKSLKSAKTDADLRFQWPVPLFTMGKYAKIGALGHRIQLVDTINLGRLQCRAIAVHTTDLFRGGK